MTHITSNNSYYEKALVKRRNRKKEVRRNMILLIVSFSIIVLCVCFIFTFSAQAQDANTKVSYKYFKSIYIEDGDSLWSIAQEYADEHYSSVASYITEVKRMNSLESDSIKTGSYLIVPYYSTEFICD